MSDDPKQTAEAASAAEIYSEASPEGSPREEHDAELARLQGEVVELKDRLIRTLAEMENLRRRTEREVKEAGLYAISSFARDTLSVADNLRRALEALPPEARGEGGAVATLVEGVELTERELLKALEKHGVRKVEAQGVKFDPNFHQAMLEVPDSSLPHGTVVQVMQDGFVIGERVLRPALVAVAKGGRKSGAAAEAAEPGATLDRSA